MQTKRRQIFEVSLRAIYHLDLLDNRFETYGFKNMRDKNISNKIKYDYHSGSVGT